MIGWSTSDILMTESVSVMLQEGADRQVIAKRYLVL